MRLGENTTAALLDVDGGHCRPRRIAQRQFLIALLVDLVLVLEMLFVTVYASGNAEKTQGSSWYPSVAEQAACPLLPVQILVKLHSNN
jgi:hypothetical protein